MNHHASIPPRPRQCRFVPGYPQLLGIGLLALCSSCKDKVAEVRDDPIPVAPAGTAPPVMEDALVHAAQDASPDAPYAVLGGAVPAAFDGGRPQVKQDAGAASKSKCNCDPSDLACNMRCAAKQ